MSEKELAFFMTEEEFRSFEKEYQKIDGSYECYDVTLDEPLYDTAFVHNDVAFDIWDMNDFYTNKKMELLSGGILNFNDDEIVFVVFAEEQDPSKVMNEILKKVGPFLPKNFDYESHIGYFSAEEA